MYVIYLHPFGRIVLRHHTIHILGSHVYIAGYDENHTQIDLTLDAMKYPGDGIFACGYCHIVAYTAQGVTTLCDLYRSIY